MKSAESLPPTVRAALRGLRVLLERRFAHRLLEVVLFGSQARLQAHEESDVDVMVVVTGLTEAERREVFDLAYDVSKADPEAWVELSVLPYSEQQVADLRARERLLLSDIDREGLRL